MKNIDFVNKNKEKMYVNHINNFFDAQYAKHGKSVKSLGWSKKGQRVRFELFQNITDLENKTVLDVGSGFGDFALFLKEKYKNIKYTGYEINESFLLHIPQEKNIFFEHRNIIDNPPNQNAFDVVYSIGTLNTEFGTNEEIMRNFMKTLFLSCNELAAISMTSAYVDPEYENENIHYYDPTEIFLFAKTLTKNVTLYHHYLPHDFTIVLYKDSKK